MKKCFADVADEAIELAEELVRAIVAARGTGDVNIRYARYREAESTAITFRQLIVPFLNGIKPLRDHADKPLETMREWAVENIGKVAGVLVGIGRNDQARFVNDLIAQIEVGLPPNEINNRGSAKLKPPDIPIPAWFDGSKPNPK